MPPPSLTTTSSPVSSSPLPTLPAAVAPASSTPYAPSSLVSLAYPPASAPADSPFGPTPASLLQASALQVMDEVWNATMATDPATSVLKDEDCFNCLPSVFAEMFFLVVGVGIVVVGILGNAFVVGVIVTDRKLLNSSVNLFLLNLALADMGNLIFCAPDLVQTVLNSGWMLPPILCPTFRFLQEYFLFASVLLQMSIGIERFMAICSPLQMQRFSRRTTGYFLACAWACACLFACPFAFWMRGYPARGKVHCHWVGFPQRLKHFKSMFTLANSLMLYLIPLVLLTVLYTIMCRRLWGKECSMIANEAQQVAILRLRRSVVKMLVISMLLYFICYTPIQALGWVHLTLPTTIRFILHLLTLASSAANPIVYICCCRHFHLRFLSMMSYLTYCCASDPEKYQTVITDADKSLNAQREMSRSPYVSFRRSTRRQKSTLSVTLL